MSRASIEAALARSQALFDWKYGVHDNPYPPGQQHDEYERLMDEMEVREQQDIAEAAA